MMSDRNLAFAVLIGQQILSHYEVIVSAPTEDVFCSTVMQHWLRALNGLIVCASAHIHFVDKAGLQASGLKKNALKKQKQNRI